MSSGLLKTGVMVMAAGLTALALCTPASAARVRDIANIDGVRDNQLIGFGLVGGLAGTGDDPKSAPYTAEAIANMMATFGFTVEPAQVKVKNFAAVMVTCDLPAFVKSGDRLDVTVSAAGTAKSLEGGQLYQALLRGADGEVYAVAQGSVSLGSTVGGGGGGGGRGGYMTVGRVPQGALVENTVPSTILKPDGGLRLNLRAPDFTTASALVDAVNTALGAGLAFAQDAGTVRVSVPPEFSGNLVPFIALIENLEVQPGQAARVVINQRTGTVVLGHNVTILPVAVTHGTMTLTFGEKIQAPGLPSGEEEESAPAAAAAPVEAAMPPESAAVPEAAAGEGVMPLEIPETAGAPVEPAAEMAYAEPLSGGELLRQATTAEEVALGLNKMNLAPADVVAIFEAIDAAGALLGELEVI